MKDFICPIEFNADISCFDGLCEVIGLLSGVRHNQGSIAFMTVIKQ
jgi:hypothetical protein